MKYTEYLKPNSKIYNPEGEYGGNQCSPDIIASAEHAENDPEYQQLCLIVKSHFPDMSSKDINDFLLKLRNESCAYVSMINSLFEEFIERPDDFYKVFGFHMYDPDGTLNYNQILVDLYCKKDNHNPMPLLFWTIDHYNKNEDREWKDQDNNGKYEWVNKPYGNNDEQIKYRWESYCKDYGIKVKVWFTNSVNTKNYYQYRKKGHITICVFSDYKMTDDNGNVTSHKGGHAMTVTGVTEDKEKFIVSSWGKRYYLNPKDVKKQLRYRIITYKNKHKKN